jgi:hypothetical protein
MFNVGDIVSPVDEPGRLTVIRVNKMDVEVEDEHGFAHTYPADGLVLVRHELGAMVSKVPADKATNAEPGRQSKKHLKNRKKDWIEYDLHAGVLIGNTAGMSNHEILMEQLSFAREMIEKARRGSDRYLVFVHGKGKGKLRHELHKMLTGMHKIDFYDAEYSRYSGGATAIELL